VTVTVTVTEPGPEPATEVRGTGTLEGRIAEEPRGSEGFGYDPVFVPEGEERTVAELGDEWKSRNSHRALAARALLAELERRR
jgi:XTP/dITP diphosphohydrolase